VALDFVESNTVVDADSAVTTVDDVECVLDADGEPFRFIDVMAAIAISSLLMLRCVSI
jgi:hypothetical protein